MAEEERLESRKLLLLLLLVETVFWFVVISPNCRYSLVKKLKSIKERMNCASVKTFLIQFVFFSVQTCSTAQLFYEFDNCWLEIFFGVFFYFSCIQHRFNFLQHFSFLICFQSIFLLAFFKSDCELIDAKYSENIPIMKQIFVSVVFCAEMFKIQRQTEFDEFLFVFLVFILKRIETFSFAVLKRILFMLVCYRKIN